MTRNRELPTGTTARWVLGAYAVICYLVAMTSLLFLAGFLADVGVPKDVDSGPVGSPGRALALVLLFAVPHSLMARGWVKRRITRVLPPAAERSTYVLTAGLTLLALMGWWHPLPTTLWRLTGWPRAAVLLVYAAGWVLAVTATFQVSHADLFGLGQAWAAVRRRRYVAPGLVRAGLHRYVRHPLMLGLLVVVWAAPTMTTGHLALAGALTVYIAVGTVLEERDLLAAHGRSYGEYRRSTPALLPGVGRVTPGPEHLCGEEATSP